MCFIRTPVVVECLLSGAFPRVEPRSSHAQMSRGWTTAKWIQRTAQEHTYNRENMSNAAHSPRTEARKKHACKHLIRRSYSLPPSDRSVPADQCPRMKRLRCGGRAQTVGGALHLRMTVRMRMAQSGARMGGRNSERERASAASRACCHSNPHASVCFHPRAVRVDVCM